jgi:hypothetical protein
LHGTAFARKGAKEVYLCCKKWLLRRSVYSHKNLITELEVFSKDFHKETGKILPQSGKRIDFCDALTQRGLKDAATHVGEFLKAWTGQAEP